MSYRILEHMADIGFEAEAGSLEALFEESARALLDISTDRADIRAQTSLDVSVSGEGPAELLVNFLSEVVYLFDAGTFAPADVDVVRVAPDGLRARLVGEPREPARHRWRLIVKAVTYHGLEVSVCGGRWRARVFLDV